RLQSDPLADHIARENLAYDLRMQQNAAALPNGMGGGSIRTLSSTDDTVVLGRQLRYEVFNLDNVTADPATGVREFHRYCDIMFPTVATLSDEKWQYRLWADQGVLTYILGIAEDSDDGHLMTCFNKLVRAVQKKSAPPKKA
ncbi:unnamed protein product, partial [Amoebophrya sp. A120]